VPNHLAMEFHGIDPVAAATWQMEGARIDLQKLSPAHR